MYPCLENPKDRGDWQEATVHRFAKSWTQLKQFSTHTCICINDSLCCIPETNTTHTSIKSNLKKHTLSYYFTLTRITIILLRTQQDGYNKKIKTNVSWDVEKLGPLYIAGRNVNSLAILQNAKCRVTIRSRRTEDMLTHIWSTLMFMFIVALFKTTKWWKQPKCPSTDEWINKYGLST